MSGRGLPPGRAGRLRLRLRLDTALRGADVLDRKLLFLLDRERVLRKDEEASARLWSHRLREAETWLLRGMLVSGEQALAPGTAAGRATLTIAYTTAMGVRYPAGVICVPAVRPPDDPTPRNSALVRAEAAYRDVVSTAAEYASAREATRLVAAEVRRTRQRVRALRHQWIPRLSRELVAAEQSLEQAEHEESVRRRWASAPGRVADAGSSRT
ncbi:V-type ATP synthase subunit D [Streptomyces sp. NPDC056367]|uniref:V-type ATP synthase subunit D n=1 Tax=Streptomyces sp. NPDC056367 TaxID=3345797 RepID=UPI0035D5FA4A